MGGEGEKGKGNRRDAERRQDAEEGQRKGGASNDCRVSEGLGRRRPSLKADDFAVRQLQKPTTFQNAYAQILISLNSRRSGLPHIANSDRFEPSTPRDRQRGSRLGAPSIKDALNGGSGGPGTHLSRSSHRSGRARLMHPAPHFMEFRFKDVPTMYDPRGWQTGTGSVPEVGLL